MATLDDNQNATPAIARLVSADGPRDFDFIFPRNPSKIGRPRHAKYSEVPLARHDDAPTASGVLSEWSGNAPGTISLDFALHRVGKDLDVEADIDKFHAMLDKDPRTGEPPDLLFIYGPRFYRVRLESFEPDEKLYSEAGRLQYAMIRMNLRVLKRGG